MKFVVVYYTNVLTPFILWLVQDILLLNSYGLLWLLIRTFVVQCMNFYDPVYETTNFVGQKVRSSKMAQNLLSHRQRAGI